MRILVLNVILLSLCMNLRAQEVRTIDGTDNNLSNPTWGAAHGDVRVATSMAFTDGFQMPAGLTRPNPRHISNQLFKQDGSMPDPTKLSDYIWVFGQFIDHDITLVENNSSEPLPIAVPPGDPQFDPFGIGNAFIPMVRNKYQEGTGTAPGNPRKYSNGITAYIDGSAVYGSDEQRAAWLRTFEGGHLKMSAGNLLPFNTRNSQYTGEIDPNAPEMENANPSTTRFFVAGDVRANENVLLAGMHTLFVREHNRLCDSLIHAHPDWTDEQLYQHARKLIGGVLQSIVYEEWLPHMGIHLPDYEGYHTDVNPNITNAFSAAAFRFGHTLLNSTLQRLNAQGEIIPEGNITLKEAFFQPSEILLGRGLDPLFKGMAHQMMQSYDCRVVEDVRSFLFGQPGQGGLDLVSINIMRGRERGLPDFNTMRTNLGLPIKQSFEEICPIPEDAAMLESLYGTVYNIDPWVGMLAEARMPNSFIGETAMTIVGQQFLSLRDGDRFYYQIDPDLSVEEKAWIQQQRMSDIVRRNSGVQDIQDSAFVAEPVELATSVNEPLAVGADLIVFPNPTPGNLNLDIIMDQSERVAVRLLDASGRVLESSQYNLQRGQHVMQMDINQPEGLYIVQLQTNRGVVSQRIVVL